MEVLAAVRERESAAEEWESGPICNGKVVRSGMRQGLVAVGGSEMMCERRSVGAARSTAARLAWPSEPRESRECRVRRVEGGHQQPLRVELRAGGGDGGARGDAV
eukprot:2787476-Pleurochrysis_carterae.AAC.1